MVDMPLKCFKNVKTTSHTNVLFGNNGCLSTVARVGAVTFSGANALAANYFSIASVRTREVSRSRLLALLLSIRRGDARPVTRTVIHCTGGRGVSTTDMSRVRRLTKRNIRTIVNKRRILIKGVHLVGRHKVSVPRRLSSRMTAMIVYTVSGGCTNRLLLSSALGSSTMRTVTGLEGLKIASVHLLSNSGGRVITSFTEHLKVSQTCKGLLPRSGTTRVQRVIRRPNGAITFIKSKVGSTPMLTLDRMKVTVNKLNSSTTVRDTSIIVRGSRPSGITATVAVKHGAHAVIRRGVVKTLIMGKVILSTNTLKCTAL